ncbi:outer membrane beta-barrel protein [Flavobacterium sp. JP2137]|uniref:outer membrane beta-barrel protein n=1 Tax=Flavobacterium sp. JP2137 TaxID=3414510 RepID=UPI003D2FBB0B
MMYAQSDISGKVFDPSKAPLGFVNVVLYNSITDELVAGTMSDDKGSYLFSNIKDGSYLLEISFIGFKTQKSAVFVLSNETSNVRFDFVLEEDVGLLNEVVIKSRRPTIQQTAEKLIVNLEQSQMVSSNLQDVLKKVPGIIVVNGKVTYGGQQGVKIFVNGKTTDYMDMSSLLRDFPADNIAKVELIQQPGAEFDAEGSGPIINIILKKNVSLGTNGNVKLNTGYDNRPEYGISSSIASYRNKLNWQVDAGYKKTSWREDLFITRRINNEVYDQATIAPYSPKTIRFNGGLDYHINERQIVGFGTRVIDTDSERIASNNTDIVKSGLSEKLRTENSFERRSQTFNLNPYYRFENEGNQLILDMDYVHYDNDNINNIYKVGASEILYDNQRYFQNGKYKIMTYKGDYKRTMGAGFNWMLGTKYSKVSTDNDLDSFSQNTNEEFILDPAQSNRFLIDENIFALYFKMVKKWKEWSFSGGIRWENSYTEGTSSNPHEVKSRNISKVFPSASIDKKINEQFGANLSYSYRILRPSYSSLNTFVFYYDPYTFEQGNPNLKPEFTNSFQFNLSFDSKPFFSIAYKNTNDALFEMVSQNDLTAQTSRSMINLSKRENWNFRGFAPVNFIAGLEGYTGIIVNYNKYESSVLNPKFDLDKWSFTWYSNLEYQLPWKINSELVGYYGSFSKVVCELKKTSDFCKKKRYCGQLCRVT